MSLRRLLENQFPLGTTETSFGEAAQSLAVSSEGFKEIVSKLFRRQKNTDSKAMSIEDIKETFKWVEENLVKGDLTSLSFKDGNVTLGPRNAPFFVRGKDTVTDVVREVTRDLTVYQNLYGQYKQKVATNNKHLKDIDKQADTFLRKDTQVDQLEAFATLMKKWDTLITPLNAGFRDPNHTFLGYGDQSFLKNGLFADYGDDIKVLPVREVTLPPVTSTTVKPIVDLLGKVWKLQSDTEELTDGVLGLDITDPPFRAYAMDVVEQHPNLMLLYTHPNYESVCTNLMEHIAQRLSTLADALVAYIRNSTT